MLQLNVIVNFMADCTANSRQGNFFVLNVKRFGKALYDDQGALVTDSADQALEKFEFEKLSRLKN